MARTIVWLVAGVGVGAAAMLGGQKYFGDGGGGAADSTAEGAEVAGAPGTVGAGTPGTVGAGAVAPVPTLAGRDSGARGDAALSANPANVSPPSGMPQPIPADGGGLGQVRPAGFGGVGETGSGRGAAVIVPSVPPRVAESVGERSPRLGGGGEVDDAVLALMARADEAIASGRTTEGVALLRGLVQRAATRPSLDLTRQALELLRLDDDPRSRRDSLRYLQSRGVGAQAFEEQLAQAAALAASAAPESQRRAWEELSIAYDAAIDESQRARVRSELGPYIDRMIFSGRFTPVMTEHPVVRGDSLLQIAVRYGTTVDAIQRLNGLGTDVIQPRTRLRILAGKPHVWVDKSEFRLWVTIDDKIFIERPVGLGRDNRTPVGEFSIRVKQKDPTWYPPGGGAIPAGDPRNILGTRWLGFEDTDRHFGFGIHGSPNAGDIGRESSSGCIRLERDDMELVYDFIPRGTRVTIRE